MGPLIIFNMSKSVADANLEKDFEFLINTHDNNKILKGLQRKASQQCNIWECRRCVFYTCDQKIRVGIFSPFSLFLFLIAEFGVRLPLEERQTADFKCYDCKGKGNTQA